MSGLDSIMGATGSSGKTTFINKASGSNLKAGTGLESCTGRVEQSPTFESDMDVLKAISSFLAQEYNRDKKLSGVLYLHRISDVRMGSISRRSFRVFRELCGDDTLKNMVILTNMWGQTAQKVAESRETQLMNNEAFLKLAIEKGAQMEPIPLKIQVEMGKEGRDVSQTASAEKVDKKMYTEIRKHQETITALKADMKATLQGKDQERQQKLKAASGQANRVIAGFQVASENQRLATQFASDKCNLETQTQGIRNTMAQQTASKQHHIDTLRQ
ncbi:hypothetical protein VNI00_013246 [Paramarasmius palmivorus]|uniref:G domain-containing protein n=1 Tax=Paramarasmius palmivorus TaxID=297713 RepID=A0AAW0C3G2_9AGAR